MRTHGVIFDVDGTLIDSVDLHAHAWQDAFRHFGHDFPFARIRNEIGKGSDKLMATFLPESEVKTRGEELAKWRVERFQSEYLPTVRPFPCVRELFVQIRDSGRKIALATSAHREELQAYLTLTNTADVLEAHTSSDDAAESKPAPDIFVAALEKIGLPASKVIVVGDSRYDAQAAVAAGATAIGVLCGGFGEMDLRSNGCAAVYRDPEDLLDNIGEWLH